MAKKSVTHKPSRQGRFKKITARVKRTLEAAYDDHRDWRMDPRAYVLIRINHKLGRIEVGIVDPKTHTVHTQVNGKDAREIYHTIARMKPAPFSYPEHYAYLGRELMKAQIALRMRIAYTQDSPLPLPKLRKDAF